MERKCNQKDDDRVKTMRVSLCTELAAVTCMENERRKSTRSNLTDCVSTIDIYNAQCTPPARYVSGGVN